MFDNYEVEGQMNLFDFISTNDECDSQKTIQTFEGKEDVYKEINNDFSKYMHPPIEVETEENTMPKQASKQASMSLFNGDCYEVLKSIPDNSVDLVVTDPPYNISRKTNFKTLNGGSRNGMYFGDWDKCFNITEFINFLPRILKENSNVVIFNCWENLKDIKYVCKQNNITIKRCLVLNKSNPAPFNRDRMFVNDVEFALWGVYNSKNKPAKWTFNRMNKFEKCVINTTVQNAKYHPTMKDLKVIKYLINILSNQSDVVLDCFMGSGTTGVACKELNRNFIGIELDEKYFEIARKRIEES